VPATLLDEPFEQCSRGLIGRVGCDPVASRRCQLPARRPLRSRPARMHHRSVYRRKPGVVAVAGRRDLTCWAPAYALIATSRFKFATSRAKAVGRLPSTKVERTASSGVGRRCGAMRPLSGGEAPTSRRLAIIRDLGPSAPLASRQHSFWGRASTFRVICRRRCLTMKYLSPIEISTTFSFWGILRGARWSAIHCP
jgi:hypothetical protein